MPGRPRSRDLSNGSLPTLLRDELSSIGLVVLIAGVLRVFAWNWVISVPVPMLYDESMYLERSKGAAEVVSAWSHGQAPEQAARDIWFGDAIFPPLHSLVLAAARLSSADPLSAARFVSVCVSTLTAALVFIFTLQLTRSANIAYYAGILYAVYPSFVTYSHYLWTEPTFNLFLLLAAICTAQMFHESGRLAMVGYAILGGCFVGSLSLIRAAGIPLLLAFPLYVVWVWWRRSGRRGLSIPIVYVVAMLTTLAPWHLWIMSRAAASKPISKVNQLNLYMGNNPLVHLELGTANPPETRPKVFAAVAESDESPTRMALREMISHPGTTVLRMLARTRVLISPDYWAVRHAIKVRYPPMSSIGLVAFALLFFVSYWLVVALITRGLVDSSVTVVHRWLPILITLALAVGPILTIARCRYHHPMLAILLPFAAIGFAQKWETVPRRRALIGSATYGLFLIVSITAIPVVFRWLLRPSTHYYNVLSFQPTWVAEETIFVDLLRLYSADDQPVLDRIEISYPAGKAELLAKSDKQIAIQLKTINPQDPTELILRDRGTGQIQSVYPISSRYWNQPVETKIPGIYVVWTGAP